MDAEPARPHARRADDAGGRAAPAAACAATPSQGTRAAPAEPPASGEAQSVREGEKGGKGAAQHAVYSHGMSVRDPWREPDYVRVPSQGPYGEGAVRCYTGNDPMGHAYCTRVRCGVRK